MLARRQDEIAQEWQGALLHSLGEWERVGFG
jgi:hypothetical protein